MLLPTDFVTRREAKRQALVDARTAIAVLEVEVRTYDEIATLLEAQQADQPVRAERIELPVLLEHPAPQPASARRPHRRKSALSGHIQAKTRAMLQVLASAYPCACSMVSLTDTLNQTGHTMPQNTLRAAIATYVQRGYIERVRPGVFKATPAGAAAIGAKLRE